MDPNQLNQIKTMMEIVNASSNPNTMLEALAKTNPQLQKIISDLKTANMSPKDAFYKKAKELGMDDKQIELFLTQMKGSQ